MRPLKLVLTAIEGDDLDAAAGVRGEFAFGETTVRYGCEIGISGQIHYFHHSSRGTKGGGYPVLAAEELKRLDELLAKLPPDGERLPPLGRRLVVQIAGDEQFTVRIYDRGDAPIEVLELLRLSGSRIRPRIPASAPLVEWPANDRSNEGVLAISPDGKDLVTAYRGSPLRIWDPDTQKRLKEYALPYSLSAHELAYSPDRSIAAIKGAWGTIYLLTTDDWTPFRTIEEPQFGDRQYAVSHLQFTGDGKQLYYHSALPALRIQRVLDGGIEFLVGRPTDALSYFPAAESKRAIYLAPENLVWLWNTDLKSHVAKLDAPARIERVAFSPDQSHVAVATVHQGPGDHWTVFRLRVWSAASGELVYELRPFEQDTCEAIEALQWSADGRYVLAATKADSFFSSRGISIWSAKSGRHRGELEGCPQKVTGLVMLPAGRIAAGCEDGKIRIWNLAAALAQADELEATFDDQD